MRAKCGNSAKSAVIFKKCEQARFSMSVTSGLSHAEVCAAQHQCMDRRNAYARTTICEAQHRLHLDFEKDWIEGRSKINLCVRWNRQS
jgi:hypothetical protein